MVKLEKQDIIKRLKIMGLEIARQDNRATASPLFGITNNTNCFSFFERDVKDELDIKYRYYEDNYNYVYANYNAKLMNELRELLVELAK